MRLGEILLAENLVTSAQLEDALEAQIVHGGRLGTNLVELGLVSEKDLARCLGKQHNVGFAAGEMRPDPRALAFVDARLADDKDVVPMRVDATRLTVAVVNPGDLTTLDAIAFRSGKRVVPVVIPEFRMHQLLRRHFKAFRTVRAVDMNVVRTAKAAQAGPAAPAADLMSEDEFQSLYAKAMRGGAGDEEGLEAAEIIEDTPAAVPPPPEIFVPTPAPLSAIQEVAPAAVPPPPEPPAPPPLTPLPFPEAQAQLAKSSDREAIARTVLSFALSKWRRALVLSVQGALVTGWHGAGDGIREAAVQRIGIALRGQSTFKLVRDTRSHYIGPVKRDAGAAVFYRLLGAGYPTTAVILPLLVRGKVVHLLYVDNGEGQLTTPDIGELLILGQSVARSYEALLRQRTTH